jgi:hypothetical protein
MPCDAVCSSAFLPLATYEVSGFHWNQGRLIRECGHVRLLGFTGKSGRSKHFSLLSPVMRYLWGWSIGMLVLSVAISGIAAKALADDALPEQVGSFGDPAHLVFKGDAPFTDTQMRQAVQGDLQLQIACSPSAKLADYLSVLDTRMRDGFHRAGYRHPLIKVEAQPATNDVVVNLDLGQRWKCGKVIIRGASTVPVDELTKRLTMPTTQPFFQTTVSDDEISVSEQSGSGGQTGAQWVPGDPAPYDSYRQDELTSFVRRQLATMGYFHPFLRVSVEPGDQDADLIIDLIDEGPKGILDHVDFETLHRNKPEDVLHLLNIKPGDPVTVDRMSRWQQILFDSGRFTNHKILVQRIPGDDARVVLRINIREADNAPLLGQPLSDIDEALLRFRRWCLTAGDNGDDVVVTVKSKVCDARVVWGGSRGAATTIDCLEGSALGEFLGPDRQFGIAISDQLAGFYLPLAGLKYESSRNVVILKTSLSWGTDPDPDAKQHWKVSCGGDINAPVGGRDATTALMTVSRWFAPVVLLGELHEDGLICQISGAILTVKGKYGSCRIDAASGRLVDAEFQSDSGKIGAVVQRDALGEMQQSLRLMPGNKLASNETPLSSMISVAAQAMLNLDFVGHHVTTEDRKRMVIIAGRIVQPKILQGIDDLFARPKNDFSLPIDLSISRPQGMVAVCAMWGLTANSKLFESTSWPWTVNRCACFALCNLPKLVEPELRRLYESPTTGPLACLVVAELAKSVNPQASRNFARSGLVKLSPDLFASDCAALLRNPKLAGTMLQVAENLRTLGDDDIDTVAMHLPPKAAVVFRAVQKELKATSGPITLNRLTDTFRTAWNNGLHETVEDELNRSAAQ